MPTLPATHHFTIVLLVALTLACRPGAPAAPSTRPSAPSPASPAAPARLPAPAPADPLALRVVDWPAPDRSELERAVAEGRAILVADGSIASECSARAVYTFVGEQPHDERVADESASFTATIVGTWTARLGADGLRGACDGVTHFVHAIATGAFEATASTSSHTSTEVKFGGAVVGGSSSSSSSSSTAGGERAACAAATPASPRPPARCNAFIRLSLTPISR